MIDDQENDNAYERIQAKQGLDSLLKKPYFSGPGVSWKAQKNQLNITFPSTFQLKQRPYFASPKNSKQEHFSNQ